MLCIVVRGSAYHIHPLHRLLTQHRQRGVHIRAAIVYSRQNMTM